MGLYLPERSCNTYAHLLKKLRNKKGCFKRTDIIEPKFKKYRELSASNLLKGILPYDGITHYQPDVRGTTYRVNSDYILAVIRKLEPAYFTAVVEAANAVRFKSDKTKNREGTIQMDKELRDELFKHDIKSCKFKVIFDLILLFIPLDKAGKAIMYLRKAELEDEFVPR